MAIENRLFNVRHLIPIYGIMELSRDMERKEDLDLRAPSCEHIARMDANILYEHCIAIYHSGIIVGGLTALTLCAARYLS